MGSRWFLWIDGCGLPSGGSDTWVPRNAGGAWADAWFGGCGGVEEQEGR